MKRRVTVLGSTGSIGANTLDVIARHPDRFEVFALSAATRVDLLAPQCEQYAPEFAVMAQETPARELADRGRIAGLEIRRRARRAQRLGRENAYVMALGALALGLLFGWLVGSRRD